MFCEQCGHPTQTDQARFCGRCGSALAVAQPVAVAPRPGPDASAEMTTVRAAVATSPPPAPRPPMTASPSPTSGWSTPQPHATGSSAGDRPPVPSASAAAGAARGRVVGAHALLWVLVVAVALLFRNVDDAYYYASGYTSFGGIGYFTPLRLAFAFVVLGAGYAAVVSLVPASVGRRLAAVGLAAAPVVPTTVIANHNAFPGSAFLAPYYFGTAASAGLYVASWLVLRGAPGRGFLWVIPAVLAGWLWIPVTDLIGLDFVSLSSVLSRYGAELYFGLVPVLFAALVGLLAAVTSGRSRGAGAPAVAPAGSHPVPLPGSGGQNALATIAFVLAFFFSVPAVVCGHIALSQIRRTGERGRGLAIAALVLGYVGLAALAAYVVVVASVLGSS